MRTAAPRTEHYAQHAIYSVMSSGGWFTVRQLTDLCKIADPRATIRTMIERGYRFEKRKEYNSRNVHYKSYKLITEEQQ